MEKELKFLLYSTPQNNVTVDVIVKDETLWLSQKGMAELFGCTSDNISLHLKNIFSNGELDKDSVAEKFSVTAADGKNYQTMCYNLDAIISVRGLIGGWDGFIIAPHLRNVKSFIPLLRKFVQLHKIIVPNLVNFQMEV